MTQSRRLESILLVAETRRGHVRDVSYELMSAGLAVKAQAQARLQVAVIGDDSASLARALALEGVDEVLAVSSPTESFEAHVWERALEALIECERPGLVLTGFTVDAMGFAPAVAARRNLGFASDVGAVAWQDGVRASRGTYADKLVVELEFTARTCTLLMLRPGAFAAVPAVSSAHVPVRPVDLDLAEAVRSEHVEFREAPPGDVDITKSEFLLSIGRGIEDKDNIARFEQLAERLGATLSVSRPLVDAGWMPSARQVGQSGKTVKPRVYLALGISGAVQHLAGMRTAETIIAVNTDPEAPIFGVAHFGAVADLFEVADELEQTLG